MHASTAAASVVVPVMPIDSFCFFLLVLLLLALLLLEVVVIFNYLFDVGVTLWVFVCSTSGMTSVFDVVLRSFAWLDAGWSGQNLSEIRR